MEGTAHGVRPAKQVGDDCAGFIGTGPDQKVVLRDAFAQLRFVLNGGSDAVSLVVEDPHGEARCAGPLSPGLAFEAHFEPGVHKLYVAVAAKGDQASYRLGVTELKTVNAGSVGAPGTGKPSIASGAPEPDSWN
jgi:hypothetical protein